VTKPPQISHAEKVQKMFLEGREKRFFKTIENEKEEDAFDPDLQKIVKERGVLKLRTG